MPRTQQNPSYSYSIFTDLHFSFAVDNSRRKSPQKAGLYNWAKISEKSCAIARMKKTISKCESVATRVKVSVSLGEAIVESTFFDYKHSSEDEPVKLCSYLRRPAAKFMGLTKLQASCCHRHLPSAMVASAQTFSSRSSTIRTIKIFLH